jgi:hypothetical protein
VRNQNSPALISNNHCHQSHVIYFLIFVPLLLEGRAGEAWEHSNKVIRVLSPTQTQAKYRLALSDFNRNWDCVVACGKKKSQIRNFTRLGAVPRGQTDITSQIIDFHCSNRAFSLIVHCHTPATCTIYIYQNIFNCDPTCFKPAGLYV